MEGESNTHRDLEECASQLYCMDLVLSAQDYGIINEESSYTGEQLVRKDVNKYLDF